MLSYEALLDQAEASGMPRGKLRGILREYLQTLMLKYLHQSAWQNKFFFLGGTCLRLVYGLKRFSEDLDFNVRSLSRDHFEKAAGFVRQELAREGISCGLAFSYRGSLFTSEFSFAEIQKTYHLKDRRGRLVIKFETNQPRYELETEAVTLNSFGELFIAKAMSRGSLFADKIDTLRHKRRGRHVYDLIFMLSRRFPVNEKLLKINGISDKPQDAILKVIADISAEQLEKLGKEVAPFLFDERESRLVANAHQVIADLLQARP